MSNTMAIQENWSELCILCYYLDVIFFLAKKKKQNKLRQWILASRDSSMNDE